MVERDCVPQNYVYINNNPFEYLLYFHNDEVPLRRGGVQRGQFSSQQRVDTWHTDALAAQTFINRITQSCSKTFRVYTFIRGFIFKVSVSSTLDNQKNMRKSLLFIADKSSIIMKLLFGSKIAYLYRLRGLTVRLVYLKTHIPLILDPKKLHTDVNV